MKFPNVVDYVGKIHHELVIPATNENLLINKKPGKK